ncbi:hypothetical protein EBB07_04150 [Paenibacillaceae bacterium]|nr:hypothetical protein EBB07_04150 [Paenibacillaceae bacterium]
MSKPLALLFACLSVVLMSATAISLSHNVWIALLFFVLTIGMIGVGFVVRARQRRKSGTS